MTANAPRLILTPLKSALIAGHAQRAFVLVRVQAPDPEPGGERPRPPWHLALVLDRSGSMAGKPLAEALRCVHDFIDRLAPADQVSLTVFDDKVGTLAPLTPVADKARLHAALAAVHEGGSTDLFGGWEAGAASLAGAAGQAAVSRVILLSDGNANAGLTDAREIAARCAKLAEQGVSTSTYGLGRSFNEDLMLQMARAGRGSAYYGETAADLAGPFGEEFDLLAHLWARDLRLSFSCPPGTSATLLNDYPVEDRTGFPVVRLPDLALGAEAWALLAIDIPEELAGEASVPLLQAEVSARGMDGGPVAFPEAKLSLPTVPAEAWAALLPDPLVARRVEEVEAGRLLEQARAAAARGDWAEVGRVIGEARQRIADNPWIEGILGTLEELARKEDAARLAKEAAYASVRADSRLADKLERAYSGTVAEGGAPSFLRRRPSQGRDDQDRGA